MPSILMRSVRSLPVPLLGRFVALALHPHPFTASRGGFESGSLERA
jgi:hypothetical protein